MKRPKLKQENPSLSVGAMARQLSSAWKLMTPEQKKPYNEMAERDKQRSVCVCVCEYQAWGSGTRQAGRQPFSGAKYIFTPCGVVNGIYSFCYALGSPHSLGCSVLLP